VNISVPGLKPEVMIHMLGEQKIFISTKSACSSKHMDESKILTACGFSKENAISALRISLSYDTTKEEITRFLQVFNKAIQKLKEFPHVKVQRTQGRMFVLLNGHDPVPVMERCKNIFGIQSLSLAVKVENDLEKIKDAALFALQQGTDVTTFKVSVRRINKN